MLRIDFTEEERQALHHERYYHPHPRVQQRMEVLWLKSCGLSHSQIGAIARVSQTTLHDYLSAYKEGGIERLKTLNWRGTESGLSPHQDTLKIFFYNILRKAWPKQAPKSPH